MRLLLHACCGVCAAHVVGQLKNEGHKVLVYFVNPNIWPAGEYQKREQAMKKVAAYHQVAFLSQAYNHKSWCRAVAGLEKEPEGGQRCLVCYRIRLEQTAKKAGELSYDFFATTLSVSPHKKAAAINEAGECLAKKYEVAFWAADFKKQGGFQKACQLATKLDLYRQNYCGCEYSANLKS